MATADRTPMGIAHLTVVPAGFERGAEGRPGDGEAAETETDPDAA